MANTMTPSTKTTKLATDRQIEKAAANYRAMLVKHASEFDAKAMQTALGQPGLTNQQFALFRKFVEAVAKMIIRVVAINRHREPMEAIKATGRNFYGDQAVVKAMPRGEGDEVKVTFFKPDPSNRGGLISDADLEKEYEALGLKPADPISVAAVNEADPAFADEHPNGTHWQNAEGQWCYAAFDRWNGERDVRVILNGSEWRGFWWFAGVRK